MEQILGSLVDTIESCGEIGGSDLRAGDLDALGWFYQMRRSEQTGANARGPESSFNHRAGRSFAIGARYMDDAASRLRIAEGLKQNTDAVQAELGGFDFVAEGIEEADGIGIIHPSVRVLRQSGSDPV